MADVVRICSVLTKVSDPGGVANVAESLTATRNCLSSDVRERTRSQMLIKGRSGNHSILDVHDPPALVLQQIIRTREDPMLLQL